MKNYKITDGQIIITMALFIIGLFVAAAVTHPVGPEKHYSDYSKNAIHAGWSADAIAK